MNKLWNSDLNELAQYVHKANEKWWQNPVTKERVERNRGEILMLVITELAEACEGERKNLMDDKLPHRKMAEVEMADAYIRLLDFAAGFQIHVIRENLEIHCPDNKGHSLLGVCVAICKAFEFKRWDYIQVALLMIEAYCKDFNYDLEGAFKEKMAYNATREDHTHEARLQAGGKQW